MLCPTKQVGWEPSVLGSYLDRGLVWDLFFIFVFQCQNISTQQVQDRTGLGGNDTLL